MFRSLTYANVMSSVAVFLALGGTSYALTLPRNSVGSKQIRARAVAPSELRNHTVRSRHVLDHSILLQDISLSARRTLRGSGGPAGPQGPPGPAGPAADSLAVNSGGVKISGNGETGAHDAGTGLYEVRFGRDMTNCRAVATLSRVPGGGTEDPPGGEIVTAVTVTGVTVRTYNSDGQPADLPFHLIAVC